MCPPSWTRWKAKQHADGPWEQRAGGPGSRPAAGAEATGTAEHLPWGTQPTLYFCQLSPCQKVGPAVDSLTQEVRNLDLLYTTPFRETTGWMTASCLSWAYPNGKAYPSWDLHANPHLVRFPAVSIFTSASSTLLWKPSPTLRFLLHCFFEPCSLTWWSRELGATPSTVPTTASSFTFCPVLSLPGSSASCLHAAHQSVSVPTPQVSSGKNCIFTRLRWLLLAPTHCSLKTAIHLQSPRDSTPPISHFGSSVACRPKSTTSLLFLQVDH